LIFHFLSEKRVRWLFHQSHLARLQKKDTDLFIFCCPREAKFILSKFLTKPVLGDNAENIFFIYSKYKNLTDTVSMHYNLLKCWPCKVFTWR
jgi:hypothetical protein